MERDKKIFKLAILGVQVDALLIEKRIAGSVQRVADRKEEEKIKVTWENLLLCKIETLCESFFNSHNGRY